MADINDQEKQEYIGKLVNISREGAGYVGVGHAAFTYREYGKLRSALFTSLQLLTLLDS